MTFLDESTLQANPTVFPKIIIQEDEGHRYFFYDEFRSLFQGPDGKLCPECIQYLKPFYNQTFTPYRKQIHIKSVPFLVAFFPEEKEIRFYTQRLGRELFLVENAGRIPESFKNHVERALLLDQQTFPSIHQQVTKQYALPEVLSNQDYANIEEKSKVITKKLIKNLNSYRPSAFEKFSDYGLGLTADYALLRVHLLKFLAILPSLDFDKEGVEVKRVLLEALRRLLNDSKAAHFKKVKGEGRGLPKKLTIMISMVHKQASLMPAGLLAKSVRSSVRMMAKRFIAGESIEKADDSLKMLYASDRDVTLDQLGELVVSETEADHYCNEVLKLIKGFSLHVKKGELNKAGIPRAHVSIKVSALCSDFKPYAPDYTYAHVAPRLKKILLTAKEEDVFINIDAEHYHYRDIVFWVYKKILLETEELKDFAKTGIVLQAYLRDAAYHLQEIQNLAQERKLPMPIRIVKGAYWDAETVEADAHGHDAPQFLNKEETDLNFRQLIYKLFEASPHLQLCIASHNFADHAFAATLKQEVYPTALPIEHQCLHMTYEALSTALAKMGWAVRNYVPVGSLLVGMAYLVRRIMENSSQVGVLTIMRSHKTNKGIKTARETHLEKLTDGFLDRDQSIADLTKEFFNVTPVRYYIDEERSWVDKELKKLQELGLAKDYVNQFPLVGDWHKVVSSSNPDILVGRIKFADAASMDSAIDTVYEKYNSGEWAKTTWIYRSSILAKAADIMLAKRNELSALIIYEAGKAMGEALADVDEAIDFLNFYAREEERLNKNNPQLMSRGVFGVIAPWNFPLAIPCGMTAAALVAGNTVVLKSAEQTPLISQLLTDILHEAGVPEDVLIHMPGLGEVIGEKLVQSEKVAGIVFTGSKPVGMMIGHKAGKKIIENKLYGLKYPTKVITEMGGKNAVIVTANAELDETVAGILYSAFGHSGQKCSAASRVIVDNRVKDRLIERLREACKDMEVGAAFDFSVTMNPIITKEDSERLKKQISEATQEVKDNGGSVVIDRSQDNLPGYCVGPAIFDIPKERAKDSQSFAMRELFGPVLHIIGFDHINEAIEIFNSTEFALTGGIFSQSQDDIDYVVSKIKSGNIYVNRTITGARVAIEPFGGFKLSGTGPKAGGKSYLKSFHLNSVTFPRETDLVKNTPIDEKGADYKFDLCLPSKQDQKHRLNSMDKALEFVLQNFEVLFQGIYATEKDNIKEYKEWLKENILLFQNKESPNRKIPGQLSYNDFNLNEGSVLIIGYEERSYFSTVMECITALSLGLGVTVLTRNQVATDWWNHFRSLFVRAGIPKASFDIFFSSGEILTKILQNPNLRTIIVDGDLSRVEAILKAVYDEKYNEKVMKSILTPFDSPSPKNFKRLLEQYSLVRSFAVNIMRHGAPLDLDL